MDTPESLIDELARDCLAFRVRLIGRAVTSIYDHAVERHGVSIAQVNLMAAIGKIGICSPIKLAKVLQLERSTVSRNVDLLIRNGWVEVVRSDAKGVRSVTLTDSGHAKIESMMDDWRMAQKETKRLLGMPALVAVRDLADKLMPSPGED